MQTVDVDAIKRIHEIYRQVEQINEKNDQELLQNACILDRYKREIDGFIASGASSQSEETDQIVMDAVNIKKSIKQKERIIHGSLPVRKSKLPKIAFALAFISSLYILKPEVKVVDLYVSEKISPYISMADYILYVEKSNNTSYLTRNGDIIDIFKHTDAVDPFPKNGSGQKRTPEGVYDAVRKDFCYTINYPTPYQIKHGYSGSDISLHGDDSYRSAIKNGSDVTEGNIGFLPDDFSKIYNYVGNASLKIIIGDRKRPL